jgi:ATP-dependent Clp protease protease subunit
MPTAPPQARPSAPPADAKTDAARQILVPTVIEEGSRGDRAFDIYSQLLRERIVFLGQEVDDQVANLIISQMLFLEAADNEKDIHLYINSPGGMAYAGMAIYDVMQHVAPDVSTICVGMGMSAAAMILCGGTPGKRFALPNSRIMIHQGSAGTRGAPSDMEIQLREVLALTHRMAEIIAHHSGRPVEQVALDIDRDHYLTAEEAQAYGLIDDIILPRRGLSAPTLEVATG